MLSPLKPLLCRHDYHWSERHRSDRCRRCGKPQPVQSGTDPAAQRGLGRQAVDRPAEADFLDVSQVSAPAARPAPSAKVLRAQARERREALLALLDQLATGVQPSRLQAIDAVLAVIEDAHSADPVLFGSEAATHFARLHEARSAPAS
jgi:hypothetical protein